METSNQPMFQNVEIDWASQKGPSRVYWNGSKAANGTVLEIQIYGDCAAPTVKHTVA
jgi:hypothetical protein